MADTRLTRIGPARALKFCLLGACFPKRLIDAQQADDEVRRGFSQPPPAQEHDAFKVRRAFWESLIWVLCSMAVGYLCGLLVCVAYGHASQVLIRVLQGIGATLLLWGTLFVRGWDIQTFGGVTLTERVNRWIYRLLYCLGTAVLIASLAL